MTLEPLIGNTLEELEQRCVALSYPKFRGGQIFEWIYHKGARSFDDMHTIPKELREKLSGQTSLDRAVMKNIMVSKDGTQKWLLHFHDGNEAECVHIPEKTRGTLCISSQVGCTLTCTFCHTGTQMLVRNLTPGEILGQVISARDIFSEWPTPEGQRHISNIVLMGMGEPLYNYDNLAKALKIMMHPKGLGFSRHKITLSTSGVVPMIYKCAEELKVELAISLHAPDDVLRNEIVPINRKYPLEMLMEAVRAYPALSQTKEVTFEYVMLQDVNDSPTQARDLIQLIKGIPAKINLIPFNPWPGSPYTRSSKARIDQFAAVLERAGYRCPIRRPRGEDILAACGQLKSESKRVSRHV
ncbi:MAG: 23S rRNA (adenine(2503)-C(2))-methyltransferase RlmN [Alphaproteobacteria bacterium]|nr:23S rRNA (adenine(2503)-C(2))-methyltransferase RlmN [Alphaproteobacteria bacterium]